MSTTPPTPAPTPGPKGDTPNTPPPGAYRKNKLAKDALPGEILTVPHVIHSVTRTERSVTIVYTDGVTTTYPVDAGIVVID